MIYIRFPHPDLNAHPALVAFEASSSTADCDWLTLMPWLEEHQYVGTDGKGGGKCWYSEQPIAGKGDREVEHFRPKMSLSGLNQKQRVELRKRKLLDEVLPFIEESGDGYPWLRCEPTNYRLASASVNMQGSKGSIFPVLKGTARLATPKTDDSAEFAILLDPCKKEDVACMAMNISGEMEPAFDEQLFHTTDLIAQWPTDAMKWLRATVSILVYDLNDTSWIKCRKQVYDLTAKDITDMTNAISTGNADLLDKCKDNLIERTRKDAPFARAARTAVSHQIAILGASSIKAEQLTANVLQAIEQLIVATEG